MTGQVDFDALRAAIEAGTPGGPLEPWNGQYGALGADSPEGDIVLDYSTWWDNPQDADQAKRYVAMFVALHNQAPTLLAEVERLRAQVAAVEALADEYDQRTAACADGFWRRHLQQVADRLRAALEST